MILQLGGLGWRGGLRRSRRGAGLVGVLARCRHGVVWKRGSFWDCSGDHGEAGVAGSWRDERR